MKEGKFFTPCSDCINNVGGECADGKGKVTDNDGCEETYYYDYLMSEETPKVTKKFIKNGK